MKHKRKTDSPRKRATTNKKAGLPPGTLVHVGEIRTPVPAVQVMSFDTDALVEAVLPDAAAVTRWQAPHPRVWLNVHGLQDAELMRAIGQRFGLHPLVMEDILNTGQRPKIDDYGDYLYCVIRMFTWHENTRSVEADQISVIIGREFVLTFQERPTGLFEALRQRLRTPGAQLRSRGIDHLAHGVIDTLVDRYFTLVDALGSAAEAMEDEAAESPAPAVLRRINNLKHELLTVRRAAWPLREVLGTLVRTEGGIFSEATRPYLRDILDHTLHVVELLDDVRDLLGDVLNIYLSSVSNRLNQEVRVLTVLTMLFLPATLIAGIFGMNFETLPWAHAAHGFWLSIGLMMTTAVLLAAILWRRERRQRT